MAEKTYTDRSNASRAAKKASERSGVPHRFEKASEGGWIVVPVIAEALEDEVPPKQIEADDIPDTELDAAADAVGAHVAWDDEEDDEDQTSEAIARRQAERQRERDRLEDVAALALQEPTEAPDLILAGDVAEEPEEATGEPDGGRIDDPAQTVIGAVEAPEETAALATTEATVVIGVPDWYSPGRRFILCVEGGEFPQSAPHAWAMEFARRTGRTIVVRDATTFEALTSYDKNAGRAAKSMGKAPSAPRRTAGGAAKAPSDPLVKPVITSPTNQIVAKLVDRIEAKRGDLAGLREFRFKPSSTYYRKAWVYLQALIAEAEGGATEAA